MEKTDRMEAGNYCVGHTTNGQQRLEVDGEWRTNGEESEKQSECARNVGSEREDDEETLSPPPTPPPTPSTPPLLPPPPPPPPCSGFECKPRKFDFLPKTISEKCSRLKSWILSDLSKSHLIWIKLIFFFQSASLVVLYPYLVIHMRSLGLSTEEIAVVNGVIPATDIVGPPIAGFLADKIGNFRLFMSGLTLVSGASSLLLLLIPPKRSSVSVHHPTLHCCPLSEEDIHCRNELNDTIYFMTHSEDSTSSTPRNILTCMTSLHESVSLSFSSSTSPPPTNISNTDPFLLPDCYQVTECSGSLDRLHDNWEANLWAYVCLRATIDVLRASSIMMFEGAVVITIKQLGGDYGLQKLFGTFGSIIWGPISGQIIDMASKSSGHDNYAPVFWIFFAMRVICACLILKLNLSFKKPAKKVFKNLGKLIIQPHIFMFLIIFFICGAVWGFLESYLFWFLEDLGSTKLTMGISLAVGTIAGIPLTIGSGYIIRKLGNTNVIVMALALYCLRLLGYSIIYSPLQSLCFEVLKPFGNSLLMIAAMTYAKNNASISTMASLEGVMGALYYGVGKSLGSLAGGLAIEEIGVRNSFRTFSFVSILAATVYLCFTQFHERRRKSLKTIDVENVKEEIVEEIKETIEKEEEKEEETVETERLKEENATVTRQQSSPNTRCT